MKARCANCGPRRRRPPTYRTHKGVLLCVQCASAYQVGQAYPDNPITPIEEVEQ